MVMLPNRSHWKILQRTEDGHGDTGTERAILAADTDNDSNIRTAYSRITITGKYLPTHSSVLTLNYFADRFMDEDRLAL